MRRSKLRALVAAIAIGLTCGASAQSFPVKPVRLIVPFPPGGGTDVVSRMLGQKLTEMWGQQVIIDNRPGASMMIGHELGAKAPPDGYTLVMSSNNHTINPSVYKTIPYDTVKDFAPVTLIGTSPLVLVVHPSLPVRTTKELIALAKSKKGELTYASSGSGGPLHMAGELFKLRAGVDMTHVPYKGSGPAETDLVGGHVQVLFAGPVSASGHIKAGKMKPLAVTSLKRSRTFPNLPTISEEALPGYEAGIWWGLLAPAATPREVINKLHADFVKVLQMPDTQQKLLSQGGEPVGSTPEQFQKMIVTEIAQWAKVVKAANIKAD
ncbi:MAG: Bug family tripartite tricarboxylate transporter substrate binding protein [Burkholderiales bacterium]